jgi:predicted kinase
VYVLVAGWPGSGKSTLSPALAAALGFPLLAKDAVKEALVEVLGPPQDVAASRLLGRAAVQAVLRTARDCPDAVLESTWYPAARPALLALGGPFVEVLCDVPRDVAEARFCARAAGRSLAHLDAARPPEELWGGPPRLPGVGPLLRADTTGPVDVPALAVKVRETIEKNSRAGVDPDEGRSYRR